MEASITRSAVCARPTIPDPNEWRAVGVGAQWVAARRHGTGGTGIAKDLIDLVASAEGIVLMALVLALVFAESAILLDFFVPGEVGLVVAGAAAAQNDTSLLGVVAAATIGAVAGDSVGYGIGRRFGTDLGHRGRIGRWLKPGIKRARRHFERRGGATVGMARFVGALRAVVPVVAGSAEMRYRQFIAWALPAAVVWSAVMATIGYVWGDDIAGIIDHAGLAVSAVVVAIIVVLLIRSHKRKRSRASEHAPSRECERASTS